MMLNDVTSQAGATKRRKRVGRGESSGKGKTCGRGHKGVQSRSGGGTRRLSEGGQMPLFRRLPKRGFSNFDFCTRFEIVNVGTLDRHFDDGGTVDVDALRKLRLVDGAKPLVRILGKGKLEKKLTIHAHAFSAGAKAAIEQAGGKAEVIERRPAAEKAAQKRNTAKGKKSAKPAKPAKEAAAAPVPAEAPQDES